MTTNPSVERRQSCFLTVAVFSILAVPIIRAQDPDRTALNKPEKIIGNWQSVGEGETVTAAFSDKSEYELGTTEGDKKVVQIKGTYRVDASAWPLKLTLLSGEKKSYCAIAVLSNDRIKLEKLGSLDEEPTLDGNALTLVRHPGIPAEESQKSVVNKSDKIVGTWKSIGDPLALEGAALRMSFSEKGAFEMAITEESGEKHSQKGTYTLDATSSPMKLTFTSADWKGYYAIVVLPNDQLKMEELKSADQTAKMEEDAVTLAREAK